MHCDDNYRCDDDDALWRWSCNVMMHSDDDYDDSLWWWWWTVMMMMHCDDALWWYWIYHIYSVSLSISRTFLGQFGLVSCGSQRRKIPRFLGHCTPPDSHKNSGGEPVKPNGGTFVTRRYAYCSSKTFSERACEATKKLHLYLVSKFLLQIDTASCLEVAEKLELYVEHQLNRSFYIVVDCETFLAALAALYLPLSVS